MSIDSPPIDVEAFDLTLFFPFAIRDAHNDPRDETERGTTRLDRWLKSILSVRRSTNPEEVAVWEELGGPYPNPDGKNAATEYAECVYFHPFIRSFLYESKQDRLQPNSPKGKSVRILERRDTRGARLGAELDDGRRIELNIRNVHLYLFDTGVGVLSIELDQDETAVISLPDVMWLEDRLRRLYAPYYESDEPRKGKPGHCPNQIVLTRPAAPEHLRTVVGRYGSNSDDATPEERRLFQEHINAIQQDCEPFTVSVWKELLWPLLPHQVKNEPSQAKESRCPLRYEQILDDRMPILSFIAVPEPREISEGDWIRLAFVDEPGDSARWPYSPLLFADDGLKPYTFDRFWSPNGERPGAGWQNTRWLCCSYALTAVGSSRSGFFLDKSGGARAHVRFHYFKVALIAHFHRASLLRFKQQLADAVEGLQQSEEGGERAMDHFAKQLRRIQLDLLAFRNMYWFTEVSNQMQGLELFDMMSRHLRTRELFQQVFDEADKAAAIVSADRDRLQNDRSARLAVLAALFILIAPIAATLFTADEIPQWYYRLAGVMSLSLAGVLAGLCGTKTISAVVDSANQHRLQRRIGLALAVLLFAASLVLFFGTKGQRSGVPPPIPMAQP